MQNEISNSGGTRIKAVITLLIIGSVIFIADQFTKRLVVNNLDLHESWAPIPALGRIFRFTHITNSGAAFGLFENMGNVFMIVAIIVALAIVYYITVYPSLPMIVLLSLGLQLGGALGNMFDRIQYDSGVVDFVDIGFWPIFNIADASIVSGVILLAFWLWQEEEKLQQKTAIQTDGQVT